MKYYKNMNFRLVTVDNGWGVYYCTNTRQVYTMGKRYEMIIEFNPVHLEGQEKRYRRIYKEKVRRGVYEK